MDWANFYISRRSIFFATNLPLRSSDTLAPNSLLLLSCAKAVSNDEFRKDSVQCKTRLPTSLYQILMKDALEQECIDCAKFLLSTWPSKIIFLSEVSTQYEVLTLAKGPLRLFWWWLDVVRKSLTPYLRVLDFRGGVLTDCVVKILIRNMFSICNNGKLLLDDYHIILDCSIEKSTTYDDLMILLAMTDGKSRMIHVHFNNLVLHYGLKESQIWDLLKRINPTELRGLSMRYFSDNFLVQILSRFSSLTALCLYSTPNEMLPLHLLPRLRRLHLDYFQSTIASCIPVSILSQLEYLPIRKCPTDFLHLTTVPLRLQEIVLDGCEVLDSYLHLWRDLFLSLAPTLKVLQMQGCIEDTSHFPLIVDFILPLDNLVYLILCDNAMTFSAMLEHVPRLGAMPNLERMALCSSYEEVEFDIYYDEIEKKRWLDAIEEKTARARLNPVEIEWH